VWESDAVARERDAAITAAKRGTFEDETHSLSSVKISMFPSSKSRSVT
jgi:hypothetical protein